MRMVGTETYGINISHLLDARLQSQQEFRSSSKITIVMIYKGSLLVVYLHTLKDHQNVHNVICAI